MTFYRHEQCGECDAIEETLGNLVLAHRTASTQEYEQTHGQPMEGQAVLEDEANMIRGEEAILRHLEDLRKFQEDWYKYQSDTCYCD